jgi:cardiolipin synthase
MANRNLTYRSHPATRALAAIGVGAIVIAGSRLLLDLFGPSIPYSMSESAFALDSKEFVQFLSVVTGGTIRCSRITRLKNGAEFYPAELVAIRRAKHAINIEFYEFEEGRITGEVLSALAERAAAGVEVRLIVDAIGSVSTRSSYFDGLRKAGGQMRWYHPIRWNTWPMVNNRTHRKLIVIDGETGFMGGAGVADHWLYATAKEPVWRDSVFCVEGEAVAGMISTFSENWLEASGEILCGAAQFAFRSLPEGAESLVVSSTPHGGGTQARILFHVLIKSARKTIRITTPYFLPDRSARHALIEAVRDRGVQVQILTAGPRIDHPLVRKLSHRSVHHLLEAGANIYEYQPSMIHAKTMTVDRQWSVIGSTNFDHRSFALNDEVNLATLETKPGINAEHAAGADDRRAGGKPGWRSDSVGKLNIEARNHAN